VHLPYGDSWRRRENAAREIAHERRWDPFEISALDNRPVNRGTTDLKPAIRDQIVRKLIAAHLAKRLRGGYQKTKEAKSSGSTRYVALRHIKPRLTSVYRRLGFTRPSTQRPNGRKLTGPTGEPIRRTEDR
jgi:hypothetical protein